MAVATLSSCWTTKHFPLRQGNESDVDIASVAATIDVSMTTRLTWRSSRATKKDDNAYPELSPRPKKPKASDFASPQYKSDLNKRKEKTEGRLSPTQQNSTSMTGHVNTLFRNDEEEGQLNSPLLRMECRRELGGRGSGHGQLQDATDLQFMDQSNTLLVTDLVNSRLQMFSDSGETNTTFIAEEIVEPWASAVTPDGRIAVTSRKTKQVVLLGKEGRVEGSFGDSRLSCPSGIAVTTDGYYVVTDFDTSKVYVFSPSGTLDRLLGEGDTQFNQPRYVTVSRHGDIIVSDSGNHRLAVFDKDWNFVRTIGTFGKKDGCLKFPHATCTDDLGNILVCDRYNDRVSAFTRKGDFVRHLVTSAHKLRHPQGLALSPSMELYVSHGDLKAHNVMALDMKVYE